MAQIDFYAGDNFNINNVGGSGLGLYGGTFAATVPVGSWQSTTWITNSAGTAQGAQVDSVVYVNSQSGMVGGASSGINILNIPNYLATLAIEFSHSTAVQVTDAALRIYDRNNINNAPSGVTCAVCEIIHPSISQLETGSGDNVWQFPQGSAIIVSLAPSPGVSGLYAGNGSNSTRVDQNHRWHVGLSASPNSIGSKTFAMYVECSYL